MNKAPYRKTMTMVVDVVVFEHGEETPASPSPALVDDVLGELLVELWWKRLRI